MSNLKLELNSKINKIDKFDFISDCFTRLKEKVDNVLFFGRSNSPTAERVTGLYYNTINQFFPVNYSKKELDVLPAVIAERLRFSNEAQITFTNGVQLINLGKEIFSEKNEERHLKIVSQVESLLKKEQKFEEITLKTYSFS